MITPRAMDNLDLAERAREIADAIPTGTIRHAAAGSVAITCATTRDLWDARSALDGVAPDDVRQAALELFDQLTGQVA